MLHMQADRDEWYTYKLSTGLPFRQIELYVTHIGTYELYVTHTGRYSCKVHIKTKYRTDFEADRVVRYTYRQIELYGTHTD